MIHQGLVLAGGAGAASYAVVLAAEACWIAGGLFALHRRASSRIGRLMVATGALWALATLAGAIVLGTGRGVQIATVVFFAAVPIMLATGLALAPLKAARPAGSLARPVASDDLAAEVGAQYAFLETLVNTAPSLFVHLDLEGRIVDQNTAAVASAGFDDSEQVRGRFAWEVFVDGHERAGVSARFQSAAPDHEADEYESTFTNARGERRVVFWRAAPVPGADGRAVGIIATGIDITERKDRELELQRERDATTTLLEATPAAVAVLARDGTVRDRDTDNPRAAVNRAFREALGWRDEQLVGRRFLDLVSGDDAEAETAISGAAGGSWSTTVESDWLRADGGHVAFSWTASPVVDVTGRTDGLILVWGVDVSERRARENEGHRRQAFIDELTAAIPSYLVVTHPDGTIRPGGVNDAFAEMFGWEQDEIAGRAFVGDVVSPDDTTARRLIAGAADGFPTDEAESRWERRDGESRIVAWTARPVTGAVGEQLVLVSGADVTLHRFHEEEIRASRTRLVEAADEARQRLERNLHDGAQQRLVAIAVSLRLAESKLADDPEKATRIIADARRELSEALEELRELARGIHPAVLTDRGLAVALEGLVQRSPCPVELDVTSDRMPTAVEAAAYYVVAESLANVAKHAEATSIHVRIALREVGLLVVDVRDDGCGGADVTRGSGLSGLADRVAVLSGTLRIESPEGGGTRIIAEIPFEPLSEGNPKAVS